MRRALALVICGMAGVVAFLFVRRYWWFPPPASVHSGLVDSQFMLTLLVAGSAFVVFQILLAVAVFRFGTGKRRARYTQGRKSVDIAWMAATAAVFIILAALGERTWARLRIHETTPGATIIEVTGQQFVWKFRYPGADGIFGRTDPSLVDDSKGNPLGLDGTDPASRDDIVSSTLVVPAGRPVRLVLHSIDMVHSFFVPDFRLKQDAVPGMEVAVEFEPDRTGRFEIACAELCGLGHYRMKGTMVVLSSGQYEEWLNEKRAGDLESGRQ